MARIVWCSPPLRGHVTPTLEIGRQFTMAGNEVVMIPGSRFENMVARAGIEHVALAGDADFDERRPLSFIPISTI